MSPPTRPLVSLEELMFMHTVMRDRYGGGIGVRDQGLIESALARPLAGFQGEAVYRTPFLRAAVLWVGLIRNHGFVDANKRTSTMAMQLWLEREGFELNAPGSELVDTAVAIANKKVEMEEVAAWLEAHSAPAEEAEV